MISQEDHHGGAESVTMSADIVLTRGNKKVITLNNTGVGNEVQLPDARDYLLGGPVFAFYVDGDDVAIRDAHSNAIGTIESAFAAELHLIDNTTAAGQWVMHKWDEGDAGLPAIEHLMHTFGGDGVTDTTNEAYSKNIDSWTAKTVCPRDRREATAVTLGHKVIQSGGDATAYWDKTDIYDAAGDSWATGTDSDIDWIQAAGLTGGRTAYFFGGRTGVDGDETRETDGQTWVARADMLDDRSERSAAIIGTTRLVLSPGRLDRYDAAADSWLARSNRIGAALERQSFGNLGQHAFAFNGRSDGSTVVDRVDRYDPFTDTWATVSIAAPNGRADSAFGSIQGMAILAAGTAGNDLTPEGETYRFDGATFVGLTAKITAISKCRNIGAVIVS